jgi:hypothetical protein
MKLVPLIKATLMAGTLGVIASFSVAAFSPSKAVAYDRIECEQDCVETANDQLLNVDCGAEPDYCQQIQYSCLGCEQQCDSLFEDDDSFGDFFGDRDFIPDDVD